MSREMSFFVKMQVVIGAVVGHAHGPIPLRDSGFGVQSLGFGLCGLGFRVQVSGFRGTVFGPRPHPVNFS